MSGKTVVVTIISAFAIVLLAFLFSGNLRAAEPPKCDLDVEAFTETLAEMGGTVIGAIPVKGEHADTVVIYSVYEHVMLMLFEGDCVASMGIPLDTTAQGVGI